MQPIRFYRDRDHQPRIQTSQDFLPAADFLESDVQDPATGREMLDLLTGGGQEGEFTGNSYTVRLAGDEAVLENLFDDLQPACTLSRARLAALLRAWLKFLDQDNLLALVPDF